MSPHCRRHPHPPFRLPTRASTSFFSPSHPSLPFPSARIDSPFRPPGHEPPLSPPPPPLPSRSLPLFPPSCFFSLSLFLFKYIFVSLSLLFYLRVYLRCFFFVFLSRFPPLIPLFATLDRAIYPSIHLTICTHAPSLSFHPLCLSSFHRKYLGGAPRRRPSSTPHPHQFTSPSPLHRGVTKIM